MPDYNADMFVASALELDCVFRHSPEQDEQHSLKYHKGSPWRHCASRTLLLCSCLVRGEDKAGDRKKIYSISSKIIAYCLAHSSQLF